MAWAYLIGGDGQFLEHDDHALTVHPTWGAMLRGPGRWVYQASGRQTSGAHGRCEVDEPAGRWVFDQEQDPEEGRRGAVSEQVCAAKREPAEVFFADDHAGTVTVSSRTVSFDMLGDPQVHVWWRVSDADFISLAAYGLGNLITRIGEVLGPFEGRLGELHHTARGRLSIQQIA